MLLTDVGDMGRQKIRRPMTSTLDGKQREVVYFFSWVTTLKCSLERIRKAASRPPQNETKAYCDINHCKQFLILCISNNIMKFIFFTDHKTQPTSFARTKKNASEKREYLKCQKKYGYYKLLKNASL